MADPKTLSGQFDDPGSIYRDGPFWSLNSRLDPKRLAREIEQMHKAGMGGFFLHSRYGLKTAYLSEQWFQCISACVEKARELGMKAYLYDEDRWPSGFAGGQVTREHPEHRVSQMVISCLPEPEQGRQRLAQFEVKYDSQGRVESYEPIETAPDKASPQRFLAIDLQQDEPTARFNHATYLNVLSRDAVAEFIRVTHLAYADRYGKDFGERIPAMFTDEPNIRVRFQADGYIALPWCGDLPREFISRRGYDLREHLVELFRPLASGEFSKVRCDYYRTITELFVENFSAQIGQWCLDHNIALTGHMLAEGSLVSQSMAAGACMPHYEHMQWPGIDVLCDRTELFTAKQCTSVADQLGKERTLSELYGCTGWDWPLEGHKFVGDWHLAAGINFRCPHLTHYSLAGGAKRDYPASIFAHSPWWKYYRCVEDYFARNQLLLTQGTPVREVLVLHPIETAWGLLAAQQLETHNEIRKVDQGLDQLIHALTGEHYDWDFGDESLLARHAKVARKRLQVGQMSYAAVIVPHCRTLRSSTVELLQSLIEAGGSVLLLGQAPEFVDGQVLENPTKLLPQALRCGNDWLDSLSHALDRQVSVTCDGAEDHQVWTHLRRTDQGYVLLLDSHDRSNEKTVTLQCPGPGPVVLWDTLLGTRRKVEAKALNEDRLEMSLTLAPTGSALLTIGMDVRDALPPAPGKEVLESTQLPDPYPIGLTEPNSLPLDTCCYRIEEGDWSGPINVFDADKQIRSAFDLAPRSNYGAQPWYLYQTGVIDTAQRGQVQLRWTFEIETIPSQCKLVLEASQDFTVEINGQQAGQPDGWWIDEDFETIDITSRLQEGSNEVVLSCRYRPDMEIEPLYLIGPFGVSCSDRKLPGKLQSGSWAGKGLDFYTGGVEYILTLPKPDGDSRAVLRLPGISCTAAAVHVGGQTFPLPWAPFEADITDAMSEGENEVIVEVIGGRKNTLGPLHTPWGRWTGPSEFLPGTKDWSDEYVLNDHGLMQPPVLEVRN